MNLTVSKKYIISILIAWLIASAIIAQDECGQIIIDSRDGNAYKTVLINNRCWLAENLNFGTMIVAISENSFQTDNEIVEKYCYDNDSNNCNIYGGLYQWDEMMAYNNEEQTQGICPEGWYIPSKSDYDNLINFIGADSAAYILQYGSIGFDAMASGYSYFNYTNWIFGSINSYGVLRTSTESTAQDKAWVIYFYPNTPELFESDYYRKTNAYSVRCIKDTLNVNSATNLPIIKQSFKIFPNPAKNNINIEFSKTMNCTINIVDINGHIVVSEKFTNNAKVSIDISNLVSGNYIVRCKSEGISEANPLIILK